MGKYRVKEPVAYVEGNKVVHHLRPAEYVTIDDKTAGELGDAVEPMDKTPKAATKAAEKS